VNDAEAGGEDGPVSVCGLRGRRREGGYDVLTPGGGQADLPSIALTDYNP
jgi:hypothetical protein